MVLVICPRCTRHVKSSESACPFCGASTASAKPSGNPALRGARTRKRMLFGAAAGIVAGTAAACSNSGDDSGASSFYGVACTDCGVIDSDSGAGDSGKDSGAVAFYGVAQTDSGVNDASDDGDQ